MNADIVTSLKHSLAHASHEANHWAQRFFAQMDFIDQLAKMPDSKSSRWNKLTDQAAEIFTKAVESGKLDRLEKAVRQAEEILAPIAKTAKSYTILNVGHAHIDMNWMWSWPETVSVTVDTFETMLNLMDEFDDFCFSQSQASVYAIVAEHRPDLLERIAKRVSEGRWEVTASHWVEGDHNLASGESLCRHLLYTRRKMAELFGLTASDVALDFSPDTFGHAATIPSIDSRGGVKYYYMCRGGEGRNNFSQRPHAWPPVFWWRGPDGKRLLVYLETSWYNDVIDTRTTSNMLEFCRRSGLKTWMNVYGVGDHGGGPTRRDIARMHDMNSWPIYPNFKMATMRDFFPLLEAQGDKWPTLDGELNYEFTGCYTSQSLIKKMNRWGENQCVEAELAAALAWRTQDTPYPTKRLADSWTNILFGHFHDILPGSGVRGTRHYQSGLYQQTVANCTSIKTAAFRKLASQVDTSFAAAGALPDESSVGAVHQGAGVGLGAGLHGRSTSNGEISMSSQTTEGPRPFVVYNPVATQRNEVVEVMIWDSEAANQSRPYRARYSDGSTAPAQRLDSGRSWAHQFVKLAVPVSVGPMGYSSFSIEEGHAGDAQGAAKAILGLHHPVHCRDAASTQYKTENEHLAIEFDPATGGILSLVDKATGCELADHRNPLGVLEYMMERPHGMSSWVVGQPMSRPPIEVISFAPEQKGPWVVSYKALLRFEQSKATVFYTLRAHSRQVEVDIQVDWFQRSGRDMPVPNLSIALPLAIEDAAGRYEIPFGSVSRDLNKGQEVPALRWADVSGVAGGKKTGLTLMNDCKYGHNLTGSTLRLTLIRGSWDPDPLPEIGEHTIRLALRPHGANEPVADIIRAAAAFNHPLVPAATTVHEGERPAKDDLVSVEPSNVVLSSVRKAGEEDAIVLHLFEAAGKACKAKVTLNEKLLGSIAEATEVDLMEQPIEASSARLSGQTVSVDLPAHGLAAIKVAIASPSKS